MRRAQKEILDKAKLNNLLKMAPVGRLGTLDKDGHPVIKPLNFVHLANYIYFHSAREGEKIEDLRRHDRICFEVDEPLCYVKAQGDPCNAFYHYRSIIIKGRADLIENPDEKRMALSALMEKYQPEGGYSDIPEEKLAMTAVVRINIETMTGKEDIRERSQVHQ